MSDKKERLSNFVWLCVYFAPLFGLAYFLFDDFIVLYLKSGLNEVFIWLKAFKKQELIHLFTFQSISKNLSESFIGVMLLIIYFLFFTYLLGIVPAYLSAYLTGWLAIYYNKTSYIYAILVAMFVTYSLLVVFNFFYFYFLTKEEVIIIKCLTVPIKYLMPSIVSAFICRFLFRKTLFETKTSV